MGGLEGSVEENVLSPELSPKHQREGGRERKTGRKNKPMVPLLYKG